MELEDEANSASGQKIRELYYDILNSKGTKTSYEEGENEAEERKHVKKLNKRRAKELRKQQRKLKATEKKGGKDDSDSDLPFFMQDASIRAAQKERELERRLAKKRKRSDDSSDSSDSDSSSSGKKKKKKKKKKDKKDKGKKKKKGKKGSSSSSS